MTTMPDRPVIEIVYNWSRLTGFPFELACAICYAESGYDVNRVGDNGTSFGLIQVHIPAHGHDAAYWSGLDGARRSLEEMQSRWLNALRNEECADWDRFTLLEKTVKFGALWVAAQGCIPPTPDQVGSAVRTGVDVARWYVSGSLNPPKPPAPPTPPTPRPAPLGRARVIASGGANLRSAPDGDAAIVTIVPQGTTVDIPADMYIPVTVHDLDGYLGGRTLQLDTTATTDRDREQVRRAAALLARAVPAALDDGIPPTAQARQLMEAAQRVIPMLNVVLGQGGKG